MRKQYSGITTTSTAPMGSNIYNSALNASQAPSARRSSTTPGSQISGRTPSAHYHTAFRVYLSSVGRHLRCEIHPRSWYCSDFQQTSDFQTSSSMVLGMGCGTLKVFPVVRPYRLWWFPAPSFEAVPGSGHCSSAGRRKMTGDWTTTSAVV